MRPDEPDRMLLKETNDHRRQDKAVQDRIRDARNLRLRSELAALAAQSLPQEGRIAEIAARLASKE